MCQWVSRLGLFSALLLATPYVLALSLHDAKEAGLVGETNEGYLAVMEAPSPDVRRLVEDINAKRRSEYHAISIRTGAELRVVEALAGKKAINKTPPGQYIRVDGQWRQK